MVLWKPIKRYEGYYSISNDGKIRRDKAAQHTHKGKILKNNTDKDGYEVIELNKNGIGKTIKVHTLVLAAFIGSKKKGLVTNHKNGIRNDNRIENLEYVTHSQNQLHSFEVLGRIPNRGEKHYKAKLTEEDVIKIRQLRANGNTLKEIGQEFNINFRTVSQISLRTHWKHI